MDNLTYKHIIEVSEDGLNIIIYRLFSDGEKSLYARIKFPEKQARFDKEKFREFALRLGEDILLDLPEARSVFKI